MKPWLHIHELFGELQGSGKTVLFADENGLGRSVSVLLRNHCPPKAFFIVEYKH